MLAMSSEANPSKRMVDLLNVNEGILLGEKFQMMLIVHII